MSFLRRDSTTGRWVVYVDAPPGDTAWVGPCPFCPGNEAMTQPEIRAWGRPQNAAIGSAAGGGDGGAHGGAGGGAHGGAGGAGWQVRAVPNGEPMLHIETPMRKHAEGMYDAASGTGAHEIIIESPDHRRSLTDLPVEQVACVLGAWSERIRDLKGDHRIRSVFLFKNQGLLAGATLPGHVHSQVIGLPVTPKSLKEILEGARRYFEAKERCVFCDLLEEELQHGARLVEESPGFVVLAPYASRHPFEIWILPREHGPDFEAVEAARLEDLAMVLKSSLARLERCLREPAYNLFLYSGPNREADPRRWKTLAEDFHWHIQVLPRLSHEAGFEMGSGFHANYVTPEKAAEMLRKVTPEWLAEMSQTT